MILSRILLLTAALFLPAILIQTVHARPDGHRVRAVAVGCCGAGAGERRHKRKLRKIERKTEIKAAKINAGGEIDRVKINRRADTRKLRRGRRER